MVVKLSVVISFPQQLIHRSQHKKGGKRSLNVYENKTATNMCFITYPSSLNEMTSPLESIAESFGSILHAHGIQYLLQRTTNAYK